MLHQSILYAITITAETYPLVRVYHHPHEVCVLMNMRNIIPGVNDWAANGPFAVRQNDNHIVSDRTLAAFTSYGAFLRFFSDKKLTFIKWKHPVAATRNAKASFWERRAAALHQWVAAKRATQAFGRFFFLCHQSTEIFLLGGVCNYLNALLAALMT